MPPLHVLQITYAHLYMYNIFAAIDEHHTSKYEPSPFSAGTDFRRQNLTLNSDF